jgi:nucleotide-binding universal stress UspA family protein
MSACIICGIDGSGDARRAASVAARLARDLHSQPVLVHVEEDDHRLLFGLRLPRPGHAHRQRRMLKAIAEECCFPKETRLRVRRGDPAAELLTVAREQDGELVVVSTGGLGTASPALLGATSSALMHSCPCPVVVVPTQAIPPLDSDDIRSVVCAVEARESDVRALRLAADLAARLGADLHAVHAYGVDAKQRGLAERTMTRALSEAEIHAQTHVLPLPADEALERVARLVRAGLIAVGPPTPGPGSMLDGPVAIPLAAHGSTTLVVLPAEAELEVGSGHYELAAAPA